MPNIMHSRTVADIQFRGCDSNGDLVDKIYWRKPPSYAIYRTTERGVLVHLADDVEEAEEQRAGLAPVNGLRDEIDGLVQSWRTADTRGFFGLSNPKRLNAKATCTDRRVAGALAQVLQKDTIGASLLLEKIKSDILEERIAWARFEYLLTAFATSLATMFVAWVMVSFLPLKGSTDSSITESGIVLIAISALLAISLWTANKADGSETSGFVRGALLFAMLAIIIVAVLIWPGTETGLVDPRYEGNVFIWRSAAAGSVGAFFSISIAIRGRTVLPDLLRTANMMDALLRVIIGAIGGIVLISLIRAGVVTFSLVASGAQHFELIVGFIAGFSERLVPDLLEKASSKPGEINDRLAVARARQMQQADKDPVPNVIKPRKESTGSSPLSSDTDFDDDDIDAPCGGLALGDDDNVHDDELPLTIRKFA